MQYRSVRPSVFDSSAGSEPLLLYEYEQMLLPETDLSVQSRAENGMFTTFSS
jgi:hypothetical protein